METNGDHEDLENEEFAEEEEEEETPENMDAPDSEENSNLTQPQSSEPISPFKRPSDTASIDGSTKGGRERHASLTSEADSESDTTTDRRTSTNEDLAAQYAQQLAFYRKPIV